MLNQVVYKCVTTLCLYLTFFTKNMSETTDITRGMQTTALIGSAVLSPDLRTNKYSLPTSEQRNFHLNQKVYTDLYYPRYLGVLNFGLKNCG